MKGNINSTMFDFERLYWSPFTRLRGFDEERWVTVWQEYDGRPKPTTIPVIDSVVERLHEGRAAADVAAEYGITPADLSTVLRVLTGMTMQKLEHTWRLRMVDELLRYTQMQIDEIARRCGYSSATSLSRYLAQHTGQSPTVRRRVLRKQGDLGKFGL